MTSKKVEPRTYPKCTLQRATAAASARADAGDYVNPQDLGSSRGIAPATSSPAAVLKLCE
jgi:hypothetical protein